MATRRVSLRFAWYDIWVGAFWDREKKRLYVCPLPMVLLAFQIGTPKPKFGPLKVNGKPVPPEIMDGPPGAFARYCGETDPAVLAILDAEDPIEGHYTLEVSSPGLDRPLHGEADYRRFVGRLAKLSSYEPVEGRRHWTGRIVACDCGTGTGTGFQPLPSSTAFIRCGVTRVPPLASAAM